jgi:hypothetical protein
MYDFAALEMVISSLAWSAIEAVVALPVALVPVPPTVAKLKFPLVSEVNACPAVVGKAFGNVNV